MLRRWSLLVMMVGVIVGFHDGCARLGLSQKPSWIDGASEQYPSSQYLVGIGQADSRATSTERAYAAVAKIFKAEISAQARDWESYLVLENRGKASTERRLSLDHVTNVSTDKVLENVQILDTWFDRRTGQHYVMAGMNRAQSEAALLERIAELDRTVETEMRESRENQDKLTRVRNMKRATKNLVLREAYNADLRVIRTSGQGVAPVYRVADLANELEQFL
ncbi:MAG TPA: LPP20 family lipoprotein, partial [Nitrospiraceae bacterium]|nr:LPP20 family lipoprotein [Nitrospiraceae bacterium]